MELKSLRKTCSVALYLFGAVRPKLKFKAFTSIVLTYRRLGGLGGASLPAKVNGTNQGELKLIVNSF